MTLDADTLRRLSPLLDEALDLDEAQREAWLNGLSGDVAELGPLLRTLLASDAARETGDFLRSLDLADLDPAATADDFHPGDAVGPYRLTWASLPTIFAVPMAASAASPTAPAVTDTATALQPTLDPRPHRSQCCGKLAGIGAAGLGHVRPATALAAHLDGHHVDQLAGLDLGGQA